MEWQEQISQRRAARPDLETVINCLFFDFLLLIPALNINFQKLILFGNKINKI